MHDPRQLPGKTTRPLLVAAMALAAAAAFWWVGPAFRPAAPPDAAAVPSPPPDAAAVPSPLEAGGFADGSGVGERTAPAVLAPTVLGEAAADGHLSLLIYGDEQARGPAGGWPARAASTLQQRLRVAPAPWTGVAVDLDVVVRPGLTAADALVDLTSREVAPELVVVAVGWADGAPAVPGAEPPALPIPADPARAWWLEELAGLDTHRDIGLHRGFYVRAAPTPAVQALRYLELLDAMGQVGHGIGAAVVYLEEPVWDPRGDRLFFASAAMRPQPWISLAYGLEQQPDPQGLVGATPPSLSPRGHAVVGRFVGLALVPVVLGGS